MEREEPLPARIDRYEPLKKIATGGMAEIFLAKQSGLEGFEKVVVLKRILGHLASDDEFVSMFLDEARIAAKLSHPNIVQIYDLGRSENTYYIAMEYVSGRNVQHLITKQQVAGGFLPVEHVVRIIAGVCDGLFYAHSRKDYDGKALNIIHRDISPQNILVSFAGGVKVVDFGIAKASTQLAQTRAGVLKGKYAYMSPEQVKGTKIDHRSDIFAVGLVMYEMLTGVRAFERDSSLKTLKAIVQDKPANPQQVNPAIPGELIKVLAKALEKNPERRYKTAQEFQLALEDWLEQSPKKSNNVRLSRFLYELFDDELNSAEGTMVVKGVGQIVIPTSRGEKAKPAVDEEIDSKTLTAALVEPPPSPAAVSPRPAGGRVRDELGPDPFVRPAPFDPPVPARPAPAGAAVAKVAPRVEAALKQVTLPPDEEEGEDRTVPTYDIEKFERELAARERAKAEGAGRNAAPPNGSPASPGGAGGGLPGAGLAGVGMPSFGQPGAGVPGSGALARGPVAPVTGAPMTVEKTNANATATSEASAEASIELAPPVSSPAASRALFDKVDAMARSAQVAARSRSPAMELIDDEPRFEPPDASRSGPLAAAAPLWEPPTNETPRGSVTAEALDPQPAFSPRAANAPFVADSFEGLADAATIRPDDGLSGPAHYAPLPSTVPEVSALRPSPLARTRPTAWYALAGASALMSVLSVGLFAFGALAFPAPTAVTEFGVVVLGAAPPGTTVSVGAASTPAPGQLVLPLDGSEHVLDIVFADGRREQRKVTFVDGTPAVNLDLNTP